jgi:hypothetical protein
MKSEQHPRTGAVSIVATTRFAAGSILETVGPPLANGRAAAVRNPDRARRDGDPIRMPTDWNRRENLVRLRIDA